MEIEFDEIVAKRCKKVGTWRVSKKESGNDTDGDELLVEKKNIFLNLQYINTII